MAMPTWLPVPLFPRFPWRRGNSREMRQEAVSSEGGPVPVASLVPRAGRGAFLGCILSRGHPGALAARGWGGPRFLPQSAACLDHLAPRCLVPKEKLVASAVLWELP